MDTTLQRPPAKISQFWGSAQSWYGKEMVKTDQWIHHFSEDELRQLDHAIKTASSRDVDLVTLTEEDFPLEELSLSLRNIRDEILHGRGFVLFRGLPTNKYSLREKAYAFRGIGAHFGEAVPQNSKGHLLGHVTNTGLDYSDPTTRGYQTAADLRFHTDASDIVGLLCVQGARAGGYSRISSSTTVWNEVAKLRPDLASELIKDYYFTRWGEIGAGQKEFFKIPIFQECNDRMISVFISAAIEKGQALSGVPALEPIQREALSFTNEIAGREDIKLDMEFRPGDMQFLLNHSIYHSRTSYEDWPELSRRRHLLRLWLACPTGPQLPDYMTTEFQGKTASGRPNGFVIPGVELKANLNID